MFAVAPQSAIEAVLNKPPPSQGPLSEIEYWRDRNAALTTLYEQVRNGPS